MRFQISIWAMGTLGAALLAAGCGSNSEAAVTKHAFLTQADAICVTQKQKVEAIPPGHIKETIRASIAALGAEAHEIEGIGIPSGGEQKVKAMLKNVNKTLDLVEANVTNLSKANEFLARAEEEADAYGLKQCWLAP